ncbi:MAG: hypothetical protein F6K11_27000 [Leptolyngbya sp. SIO3F4]|nr:hypothetical protein [Leptolyngbya sp. SIO3F4]
MNSNYMPQELDESYEQLALEAQKSPPGSVDRQKALSRLVNKIFQSGRLYRPSRQKVPPQFQGAYQEIINNALQLLAIFVCEHIDKYDPERGTLMGWINHLMAIKFIHEGIDQIQDKRLSRLGNRQELDEFIAAPSESSESATYKELRTFIEEDPENILRTLKMKSRPDITFQLVLIRRLNGQTLQEIANAFKIPLQTLAAFYRRSLHKVKANFRDFLDP